MGLSLETVTAPKLIETELKCTLEAVGMNERGAETDLRLSVPIVSYQKEKDKCVEIQHNSEYFDRLYSSVARLSEYEINVHLRIEKMLNKNQSVAQHSRRVNRLTETLAECGSEIMRISDELSENAWASQQLGENEIELFCTMEKLCLRPKK